MGDMVVGVYPPRRGQPPKAGLAIDLQDEAASHLLYYVGVTCYSRTRLA